MIKMCNSVLNYEITDEEFYKRETKWNRNLELEFKHFLSLNNGGIPMFYNNEIKIIRFLGILPDDCSLEEQKYDIDFVRAEHGDLLKYSKCATVVELLPIALMEQGDLLCFHFEEELSDDFVDASAQEEDFWDEVKSKIVIWEKQKSRPFEPYTVTIAQESVKSSFVEFLYKYWPYGSYQQAIKHYNRIREYSMEQMEKLHCTWGEKSELFYWVDNGRGHLDKIYFREVIVNDFDKLQESISQESIFLKLYNIFLTTYKVIFKENTGCFEKECFLMDGIPMVDENGILMDEYNLKKCEFRYTGLF